MGRYGMLDCSKNYKTKYKDGKCKTCGVVDDESHRINECVTYKNVNYHGKPEKINFAQIYSSEAETLSKVAGVILDIWELGNGRNEMKLA